MKAKIIDELPYMGEIKKPDEAELTREYNYMLASELTGKLLDKGLITKCEYEQIMAENRKTFMPIIASLIP